MRLARRAWRIVFAPASEWESLRKEDPGWRATLVGHALPLALLPALGWASGISLNAAEGLRRIGGWQGFLISASQTLILSLLVVAALALGVYLLSRIYGLRPDWDRSFAVAAFGSTPIFLAGALLVVPILVIVSMVAVLHSFFLYYGGVVRVLDCPASEAAGFVAISCAFTLIASVVIGALGSALGLL